MISKRFFVFALFFVWLSPELHSEVKFHYYTIQDKLSHVVVYAVEKDHSGLMWFATRNGVDSYDGKNFKHYDLITDRSPYAESNSARELLIDAEGSLWVGSDKGLLKYDADGDTFVPFLLKEGIPIRGIVSMYMDEDGLLWLGSYRHIYVIDPARQILVHMFDNCQYVRQFVQYDNESLIYFSDRSAYLVNRNDYSRIEILYQIFGPTEPRLVASGFKDKNQNFWLATDNKGVFITDRNFNIQRKIDALDFLSESKSVVRKIFYLNENEIGILTDGEGLIILGDDYQIKQHFFYDEENPTSLNSNALSDIYIDDLGRTWITTIGGGINLYDPNLLPFHHIKHQPQNDNSLKNNIGKTVLSLDNGELWFGTEEGISIWNEKENKWSQLLNSQDEESNADKIVMTLEKVSDKEIWIGSYGGGIDIYDLKSGSFRRIEKRYENSISMNMDYVFEIFRDSEGNVWIGSARNPLIRFDPETEEFFTYPITNVLAVYEAKNGLIYIGTRSGFSIFRNEEEVARFNTDSKIDLSSNYINCFMETKGGKIIMGTEGGGLNIFDPSDNSNLVISKKDGLASNIIHCILPDKNGIFWLSTSKGLSAFNLESKKIINYGLSDGLPVLSFVRGNGVKLPNGQMIFGGYEGYVRFDPGKIVQQEIPVKLKLLDFKVANISAAIGGEGSPLVKHIDKTEQVSLNYLQNSFTIDYIGINYTNPDQNLYSWKLEGFDEEWAPWTNDLSATYTNIGAGDYVFKLRVSNPYGQPDSRSLDLVVKSPWWLSGWAFAFYTIVILVAGFFFFYFLRIKYREKQSMEKIRFFTNIAHDIKTPLTLIHTPLKKIIEEDGLDKDSKNSLELAMHNAEKIKSIANQLLDFQKADLKKMELQLEESNFVRHIKEISKSFNPLFEKKNVKFKLLTEIPVLEFYYDKKIIEKVVNNLLSNAIKYTDNGGNVEVKIKVQGKHCILKVCDNGIGIPENQKKEIFKRYFRATNAVNSVEVGCGVGLMLVRELVEMVGGEISFTSKENKGTCFTVKLKIVLNPDDATLKNRSKLISVYEVDNKAEKTEKSRHVYDEGGDNLPNVLVVEDNAELQKFLKESLESKYAITLAPNGKEALEIVGKLDPDLIISDVMMPEMDGKILCHTLKRKIETCHIPIILLTALANADHRAEGYDVGADAYIEKPFDMKVLMARIENLLQIRKTLKGKYFKFDDSSNDIVYHNNLDQDFIAKANEVVQREMENTEFDVISFAGEMNVSRPVLHRKLKALTGQSPHEFILYAKLRHAVSLLKSGQLSIKEVAYSSGFSNSKYFSTIFRKYFEVTPSEFIKEKKEISIPE